MEGEKMSDNGDQRTSPAARSYVQEFTLTDSAIERLCKRIALVVQAHLQDEHTKLLTRIELAQRLGIGERTISTLVARSELPQPVRLGGSVRWDWQQVRAFLKHASKKKRRRRGHNHG